MIIVSGKLYLRSGTRDAFLATSTDAVKGARNTLGCRDFVVAADPLEPERVNVYEMWDSEEASLAFRGSGPDEGSASIILRASVARHVIASSGPA